MNENKDNNHSNEIPEKLLQPYNAEDTEARIYAEEEASGFFNPDVCVKKGIISSDAKPFTVMMPPPNATGTLHMGHAMFLTLEDIMIRYKRMQGFKTLWLPGTDHASIATQSKVEKEIYKKEKKSRRDLGREELLKRIDTFVEENRHIMTSQMRVMGASCDWSREAFTLDDSRNIAVNTVFKKMYNDGLIYRGHRIVNWDPKGQTTISDDEIVYEERTAKMYTFKYSKDFPISISTTRPETKIGDTAVAVHPDDSRYKNYIGKTYTIKDFCGVELNIKIIADEAVEMEFGTGALGVTPAHSITDWEIADRHDLPRPQVINEYAKMIPGDERLIGKKVLEAREVIVQWLKNENLLEKEEDVKQNISTAERTGGIVEPLPKLQWFIGVNKEFILPHSNIKGITSGEKTTLKKIMRATVEGGQINIIPEHFDKTYFHWIDNLRDWCISRQIWYGHRVPVWYKNDKIYCGITAPENDTNFVFLHGFYRTKDVLDPLKWLYDNMPGNDNFWEILPNADKSNRDEKIKFVLEHAHIDENTVLVCHSRGGKLAMKILEESGKKIKGLVLIASAISFGEKRKKLMPEGGEYDDVIFDFEKIKSQVKNQIILFEATTDHVYEHEDYNNIAEKLGAKHIKSSNSESHYNQTDAPEILNELKKYIWAQDEDTLDTWFSSGLWTFSTLGWPNMDSLDLKTYHPTDVLETGYDILPFWVMRMILMTGYALGDIPFRTVYLHGTVRDGKGQKMSKSLGNGMDPIDVAKKFGTDAGRMALIIGTSPGTDSKIDENKIKGYRNFANKIWNITRFVLSSISADSTNFPLLEKDRELRDEFDVIIKNITNDLDEFRFHLASEKIYHYIWHSFADVIIEESKDILNSEDSEKVKSRQSLLLSILKDSIKVLHPFMPFVTEEVWSMLPEPAGNTKKLLLAEKWPV